MQEYVSLDTGIGIGTGTVVVPDRPIILSLPGTNFSGTPNSVDEDLNALLLKPHGLAIKPKLGLLHRASNVVRLEEGLLAGLEPGDEKIVRRWLVAIAKGERTKGAGNIPDSQLLGAHCSLG